MKKKSVWPARIWLKREQWPRLLHRSWHQRSHKGNLYIQDYFVNFITRKQEKMQETIRKFFKSVPQSAKREREREQNWTCFKWKLLRDCFAFPRNGNVSDLRFPFSISHQPPAFLIIFPSIGIWSFLLFRFCQLRDPIFSF